MPISDPTLDENPLLPVAAGPQATRPSRRRTLGLALALLTALGSAASATSARRFVGDVPLPPVGSVDLAAAFFDTRLLPLTTTVSWLSVREVVEAERLRFDHTLWRRMFFQDWDGLPADVREAGVAAMLRRYHGLLATRTAGRRMSATDWDWVPQPVRAMAYVNMIEYWAATEPPAPRFDLDRETVVRTLKAMCMAESWFEHRAINLNRDGSADFGLAQASAYAREVTRRRTVAGLRSQPMRDEDYFNPWLATRWMVAWFGVMLEESNGNLELAIRAYNVGRPRAHQEGDPYLRVVLDRRTRYFEGPSGSPTWKILSAFRRDVLSPAVRWPAPVDTAGSGP